MKENIKLISIKQLPEFFTDLDNIRKLNTQEIYQLYNEKRSAASTGRVLEIDRKLNLITEEDIFLEKLKSIFDGNYLSTYFKLFNLIFNYDVALNISLDDLNHYIQSLNPNTVTVESLDPPFNRLNSLQKEYKLKWKFLRLALTKECATSIEKYYDEKFNSIKNYMSMLEAELFFSD